MPGAIHTPGRVGVVSRSGTLTYEAVGQLSALGIGQSSCVGIGGDPVSGTTFVDVLRLFNDDPETDAVVLIGEIGGTKEQEAAEYIKAEMTKPVAALIVGQSAPPGKRMGHAGAIITGSAARAENKVAALRDAGAAIIPSPADIATTIQDVLGGNRLDDSPDQLSLSTTGTPCGSPARPSFGTLAPRAASQSAKAIPKWRFPP